jgi:hypothetical protein
VGTLVEWSHVLMRGIFFGAGYSLSPDGLAPAHLGVG